MQSTFETISDAARSTSAIVLIPVETISKLYLGADSLYLAIVLTEFVSLVV